jgi:hypothetical protein
LKNVEVNVKRSNKKGVGVKYKKMEKKGKVVISKKN